MILCSSPGPGIPSTVKAHCIDGALDAAVSCRNFRCCEEGLHFSFRVSRHAGMLFTPKPYGDFARCFIAHRASPDEFEFRSKVVKGHQAPEIGTQGLWLFVVSGVHVRPKCVSAGFGSHFGEQYRSLRDFSVLRIDFFSARRFSAQLSSRTP